MDILWTKSGFHICFHLQTLSYWTKSGHILDFHVQCMSKSFMIGQGFDRHWTGLDSDWTDLVNFPAFGQTLDGGWTGFGFCVQALSNQPSLRITELPPRVRLLMAVRAVYDHAFALLGIEPVNNMWTLRDCLWSIYVNCCIKLNCANNDDTKKYSRNRPFVRE